MAAPLEKYAALSVGVAKPLDQITTPTPVNEAALGGASIDSLVLMAETADRALVGGRGSRKPLSMETIAGCQHLPLAAAAEFAGMGTTQFKLECRSLGVKRWPYRKLSGLANAIETLAEQARRFPGAGGPLPTDEVPTSDCAVWQQKLEELQVQLSTRSGEALKQELVLPAFAVRACAWAIKRRSVDKKNCRKRPRGARAARAAGGSGGSGEGGAGGGGEDEEDDEEEEGEEEEEKEARRGEQPQLSPDALAAFAALPPPAPVPQPAPRPSPPLPPEPGAADGLLSQSARHAAVKQKQEERLAREAAAEAAAEERRRQRQLSAAASRAAADSFRARDLADALATLPQPLASHGAAGGRAGAGGAGAARPASFPATAPAARPHPQAPRSHQFVSAREARATTPPPPGMEEDDVDWNANPAMISAMLRHLEQRASERRRQRAALDAEEEREEAMAMRLRAMRAGHRR